jgi:hypothetical protein
LTFKTPTKNCFSAYYFLKIHLPHFSKTKSQKEVTKQEESRFFKFLLDDRKIRIRIRIQEAQKHTDLTDTDLDPQYCVLELYAAILTPERAPPEEGLNKASQK